jgi:serine/threonine protein kinase
MLWELNEKDRNNSVHMIQLYSSFYCGRHLCLVLELLDTSLYQFNRRRQNSEKSYLSHHWNTPSTTSKGGGGKGGGRKLKVTIPTLRKLIIQLLSALLHLSNNEIIHADLKPENILLKKHSSPSSPSSSSSFSSSSTPSTSSSTTTRGGSKEGVVAWQVVQTGTQVDDDVLIWDTTPVEEENTDKDLEGATLKICDFGNALPVKEASLYYDDFALQTLQYRAPEVCHSPLHLFSLL